VSLAYKKYHFFFLMRYIRNVAHEEEKVTLFIESERGIYEISVRSTNIDGPAIDRPTSHFWKISNGHASATGHLIHFIEYYTSLL